MKKLVVDEDTCIACGACINIDEEHFDFSSKGTSTAISQENLDSENLSKAIDACPVVAIKLEEVSENCDCNCNCQNEDNTSCDCTCENCNCHNE